jgi:hypothetical protein
MALQMQTLQRQARAVDLGHHRRQRHHMGLCRQGGHCDNNDAVGEEIMDNDAAMCADKGAIIAVRASSNAKAGARMALSG